MSNVLLEKKYSVTLPALFREVDGKTFGHLNYLVSRYVLKNSKPNIVFDYIETSKYPVEKLLAISFFNRMGCTLFEKMVQNYGMVTFRGRLNKYLINYLKNCGLEELKNLISWIIIGARASKDNSSPTIANKLVFVLNELSILKREELFVNAIKQLSEIGLTSYCKRDKKILAEGVNLTAEKVRGLYPNLSADLNKLSFVILTQYKVKEKMQLDPDDSKRREYLKIQSSNFTDHSSSLGVIPVENKPIQYQSTSSASQSMTTIPLTMPSTMPGVFAVSNNYPFSGIYPYQVNNYLPPAFDLTTNFPAYSVTNLPLFYAPPQSFNFIAPSGSSFGLPESQFKKRKDMENRGGSVSGNSSSFFREAAPLTQTRGSAFKRVKSSDSSLLPRPPEV